MKILYSFLIICFIVMMIPNLFAKKQVPEWVNLDWENSWRCE